MIDRAMKVMDASGDLPKEQQFAWTLPGWVLYKTMEGKDPARKQRLEEKYRSGQIISHALPFTIVSDVCGLEEMVRGLTFSTALTRAYGLPIPRSGKLTDEPSQTGALATVLANAGVKFLHIGCNWPSGFVKTPGLFWWEGPDGSRVLTLYSPIYGTSCGLYPAAWTSPKDPMVGKNLIPARDWPYKVWPAIQVTGDNAGPPTADQIRSMMAEVKAAMPGVKVRMGTMDDFYNAIMKEQPNLPVVKAAMPDTWIHGVMCDPGGIRLSREVRSLSASAEVLHTQLKGWNVDHTAIGPQMAKAYEKMALYGEHTWGRSQKANVYGEAFKKLPLSETADLEASWEDKTDYIREAAAIVNDIAATNMASLSAAVNCKKPSVLVYNPLPWPRSGWVDAANGKLFVKNIPANGYRVVPIGKAGKQQPVQRQGNTIENAYYKLTFDPAKGTICSWIDKRTGREWVDNSAREGLGQYMNERFTYEQTLAYCMAYQQGRAAEWPHPGMHKPGMVSEKEVPYRAASPRNGRLTITDDGVVQTAELQMPADVANHLPASLLKVSLYADQPYVDVEITIKDKARDNWPEADWLCLPFRISQPVFNVYRQLGVMNPATDILPGANRHLYAAEYGVTVTGADGAGVAVCALDHPLVSLGTPGCWKYSEDYVPQQPTVYLNLYNNQWNTNFRYWYPGTWSSRVRLWTVTDAPTETGVSPQFVTRAVEASNPLQTTRVEKHAGNLPAVKAGVSVSRKGVLVTAFGEDPNGDKGTLLRVWEVAGQSGKLTVALPEGVQASVAEPINLRGERLGAPIAVKSGRFEIDLGAYAPASFILR